MAEVEVKLIGWIEERDKTVVVFDAWSLLHVLGGMAMANVGLTAPWAFGLHGAYELKDMYERERGGEFNSSLNSVADQGMAVLGHYLGRKDTTGYFPWVIAYLGAWAVYNHYGFVGESDA